MIVRTILIAALIVITMGFVLPWLFSADSDAAVAAGAGIVTGFLLIVGDRVERKLKRKDDEVRK